MFSSFSLLFLYPHSKNWRQYQIFGLFATNETVHVNAARLLLLLSFHQCHILCDSIDTVDIFFLRIVCSFFVLFDFPQWWNRSLLLVQVESSCLHLWLRYDTSIEFRAFMQPILYLAQCADKYKKKTQSFAELIDSNSQVHSIASVRGCMSVHVAVLKKEWKIKPIQFIYVTMIFVVFFKSFVELSAHHPIQPLCTFDFIPKIIDDFIVDAVFENVCKKRNESAGFQVNTFQRHFRWFKRWQHNLSAWKQN